MVLNKLCRTCLSTSNDMKSLYETCATSTQICCAEILSTFTPLICCKDDGLPTMICHNCIREIYQCHSFRLKCLQSDGVLRKHVEEVTKVMGSNITVTNQQTESCNQNAIKLEENMDENSRIFEEVLIKNELATSSKKVILATTQKDPLAITEMQVVMTPELDIVKHEIEVIKIEENVNNALTNKLESEKPYSCTICNKSFKQKQHLIKHMRTHTGEKPYPCTVCDSSFAQPYNLTMHMRTHTGEKTYPCTLCDISFNLKHHLTNHMLTHTGEKPYVCSICNKSFRQKHDLQIHVRTHTREKPYTCTVCCHSYSQKQNLKIHMRMHTEEKPYTCTVCQKGFKQKQHVIKHMRTHTGEKPYLCAVCDSSFKQYSNLKRHMRRHAGEKSHPCTV